MPYSELHRIAKANFESTQTKMSHCSADLDFPPDNEFVELVCENGQIMMQGQSNKNRKNLTGFPSFSSKAQEKDGEDAVIPTFSKFGNMGAVLNDFSSSSGPLSNMGLGQDDDIVPWLNYPLDDSLQHDYCSDFFSELTGVNLNALSTQNNAAPNDKNSGYSTMVRDSHIVSAHGDVKPEEKNTSKVAEGSAEPTRPRGNLLYHSPLKDCQTPVPPVRPKVPGVISYNGNSDHQASCRNLSQTPPVSLANTKIQRQDSGPSRILPASAGLMNFSHFARPAAVAKANLQNINVGASPGLSSMDKLRNNDKISSVGSNPVESTLVELNSGSRSAAGFQYQHVPAPGKLGVNSSIVKSPKEVQRAEQTGAACREDASRSTNLPDQVHRPNSSVAASTTVGRQDTDKDVETIVASSSICSGNSAGAASNDPKHMLKRKSREVEESECQSDDVEEESVGAKKPATARGGMGAKRSRAAEVHNLSERRRRDRINEKMRALQELIPNCNKVDKASMLDEAIEYLKTLQLQVQIMSMGTGLYMPQMMLPTGMQRMHPQHLPHFNPMGVGMGMGMGLGMGYGMGMVDMSNGGSSACSMMQMPRMHGVQYPCPSFPPVAGSNLQMFGLPGQGHPMSMPRAPYIPPSEGPSTSSVPVSRSASPPEMPDTAPSSSSKDPKQGINSQMMQKTTAGCSQNQTSQATGEGFDPSASVQRNDQTLHVGSKGNINSSNGNGIGTGTAGCN